MISLIAVIIILIFPDIQKDTVPVQIIAPNIIKYLCTRLLITKMIF